MCNYFVNLRLTKLCVDIFVLSSGRIYTPCVYDEDKNFYLRFYIEYSKVVAFSDTRNAEA